MIGTIASIILIVGILALVAPVVLQLLAGLLKIILLSLALPFIGFFKAYEIRNTQPVVSKLLVTVYTIFWLFIILMVVIAIRS